MLLASLGFLGAFALIFARVPIGIALALVGVVGFAFVAGFSPALSMLAMAVKGSLISDVLAVIPLFLLMGNLISASGVADDIFGAAQRRFRNRKGGLAIATIMASAGFAAVCGSSVATVVTIGKISLPPMRRYRYPDSLSAASVAAGGTLGILIPPSIVLVIYGIATETSIGALFAAGVIPALIGIVGYLVAVQWSISRSSISNMEVQDEASGTGPVLTSVVVILGLFVLVLGGIYVGVFTANEAAGVGAMGALLFVVVSRRLNYDGIIDALWNTVATTCVLFTILFGATIFGEYINRTGAHEPLMELIVNGNLSPTVVMLTIVAVYLALGCILESISMVLLTIPLFFPVVVGLGYDPVWFGILVVMVVEIGLITPPLGMNIFMISSILPDVSQTTIMRGLIPFIASDLVRVALLLAFPALAMWLPSLMYN